MSPLFYVIVVVGVIAAIFLGWLLVDAAMRKYAAWRDARDLRIRNESRRGAFRGSRERLL
jgi:hypothetical protein